MAATLWKMGKINIMNLINAIKVRPALYNKDDSMHSHKKFTQKLWREVCQEVYTNWDRLTPHDKVEYARELQKRWKNLRTCFSRELALQKKEKIKREKHEPLRRRKKYSYFNDLLFLLTPDKMEEYTKNNSYESDSDDDPLTSNNTNTIEYTIEELQDFDSNQEEEEEVSTFDNSDKKKGNDSKDSELKAEPSYVAPMEFTRPIDDKVLNILREVTGAENDEDKKFALSLVSIFKNLSPKKKLEARIEVLKLLQNITYRNDGTEHCTVLSKSLQIKLEDINYF